MKTILLFGKNGQIGQELQHALRPLGSIVAVGKQECDFTCADAIMACLKKTKPDLIVNAAAYTAVDKAETDEQQAKAINATAPGILAEEAKRRQIPLIHYSTDYVFDGQATSPYVESDTPNPLGVYGQTKLAGERAIMAATDHFLILRTSWVYGRRGHNFYLTMLRLAAEKEELRIVNDQIGTPNWSQFIAETTAHIIPDFSCDKSGIFHLSCQGTTTWYAFAKEIFKNAHLAKTPTLIPIATFEYPTPARRPAYSALNSHKLSQTFNLPMPLWQDTFRRLAT